MDYLKNILADKARELELIKKETPLADLKERPVEFTIYSLRKSLLSSRPAIISEIKRRSPSKGNLRTINDPVMIAAEYEKCGAAAISVLTDRKYFSGQLLDLTEIKKKVNDQFKGGRRRNQNLTLQLHNEATRVADRDFHKKSFLAAEIGVYGRLGDAGGLGDFGHTDPIIGVFTKNCPGSRNNEFPPGFPFLRF